MGCMFANDVIVISDVMIRNLKAAVEQPVQHMEYDMAKYDWERIADQVAEIYRTLDKDTNQH